ncbi:protein SRG1 [Ricinus communis]|uniref:protein SRG1 n=1 Tax=Ricinus communis TaxID=3988 RepID=UPI00201AA216|nr:protein SRG1 [Ricinus communis]XP_048229738.1 protein SRG1 [Ricinus communis]
MESKVTALTLGSSLPVPSVQELANKSLATVPTRYVRSDQDPPFIPTSSSSSSQVPVIDMEKLLSEQFMDAELERFHHACKDWGFFQLINHGVSLSLVEKLKIEVQNFFNLPTDEKKKFCQKEGDVEGFGQSFVVSEEQKLDWSDMVYVTTLPTHLRKPHLLPYFPFPLRDVVEAYSKEMENLATEILNLMAKALKMETTNMMEIFEGGWQSMRMNYYPPCPQPELVVGLAQHSDAAGLTILLQANETDRLQIKKHGKWVPIKPLANAFVINVGDILEILTNGMYPSIEHRAIVDSAKERLSIATFCSPKLDAEVGPMPSLVTPETPASFRKIGYTDYIKGFFSRKLDGKSYVDVLRINPK